MMKKRKPILIAEIGRKTTGKQHKKQKGMININPIKKVKK